MATHYRARPQRPRGGAPSTKTLLEYYDVALREGIEARQAAALGIAQKTLKQWLAAFPDFELARDMAAGHRANRETLNNYIYERLSPEAQECWEKIKRWDRFSAWSKIEALLQGKTKRIRQELFIHALVCSNFDASTAGRMIGVSRPTYERWMKEDLAFQQLIEEITWHRKNFFEKALMNLVETGHPHAVIFVNRTVNADRGYSEKLKIEHSGQVSGDDFSLDDLELDADTRDKILIAIRKRKQKEIARGPGPVVDVDVLDPALEIPEHV